MRVGRAVAPSRGQIVQMLLSTDSAWQQGRVKHHRARLSRRFNGEAQSQILHARVQQEHAAVQTVQRVAHILPGLGLHAAGGQVANDDFGARAHARRIGNDDARHRPDAERDQRR